MFHAGTASDADNKITADGGRVLGISATGKSVLEAQQNAYKVIVRMLVPDCWHGHATVSCAFQACKVHYMSSTCGSCLSVLQAVDTIDWPEGFVRRDIGWRAIKRT